MIKNFITFFIIFKTTFNIILNSEINQARFFVVKFIE